jgi:hypothetical protein
MPRVYCASKSKHWPFWQALREAGLDICASWIDATFNHTGEALDADGWREHWERCTTEAASADVTLLFKRPDEHHMGALVEAGCCLGAGKELWVVCDDSLSFLHHPRVRRFDTLRDAVVALLARQHGERLRQGHPISVHEGQNGRSFVWPIAAQ